MRRKKPENDSLREKRKWTKEMWHNYYSVIFFSFLILNENRSILPSLIFEKEIKLNLKKEERKKRKKYFQCILFRSPSSLLEYHLNSS